MQTLYDNSERSGHGECLYGSQAGLPPGALSISVCGAYITLKIIEHGCVQAYETPKVLRIRNRWLGLLYNSLALCIVVYTILYLLIYKQGYLERHTH